MHDHQSPDIVPAQMAFLTTRGLVILRNVATLGALTKDKADAAELLRACACASAHQLADESYTLQWAREEREARSLTEVHGASQEPMVKFEVAGDEKLTRTLLGGITDVVRAELIVTTAQGRMRVNRRSLFCLHSWHIGSLQSLASGRLRRLFAALATSMGRSLVDFVKADEADVTQARVRALHSLE